MTSQDLGEDGTFHGFHKRIAKECLDENSQNNYYHFAGVQLRVVQNVLDIGVYKRLISITHPPNRFSFLGNVVTLRDR